MKKIQWIIVIALFLTTPLTWWNYGSESSGFKGIDFVFTPYSLLPIVLMLFGLILKKTSFIYGIGMVSFPVLFFVYARQAFASYAGTSLSCVEVTENVTVGGVLMGIIALIGCTICAYDYFAARKKSNCE